MNSWASIALSPESPIQRREENRDPKSQTTTQFNRSFHKQKNRLNQKKNKKQKKIIIQITKMGG